MKLIELHILQSFPVSCLNRDDVGAPKSAIFGGCARARISSQCLKRAIRETAQGMSSESFRGSRTRKAAGDLSRVLVETHGWELTQAKTTADEVLGLFLGKTATKPKKGKKAGDADDAAESPDQGTSTLLYFSRTEIARIAQAIQDAKQAKPSSDAKALKDAALKAFGKGVPCDAADIAVFGRMAASAPDVTLEGAGMFSHALSTHKCDNDLDFWTAVDDEKKADEDAGAGNMGTAEFNSACYYRYAALNLTMLFDEKHLAVLEQEERHKVVDAFIRACLLAVPGARKNSMNANTLPVFVLGLVKEKGQPIQLINAFERPVWAKNGLVEKSIDALKEQHEGLKTTWGIETKAEVAIPEVTMSEFCAEILRHV